MVAGIGGCEFRSVTAESCLGGVPFIDELQQISVLPIPEAVRQARVIEDQDRRPEAVAVLARHSSGGLDKIGGCRQGGLSAPSRRIPDSFADAARTGDPEVEMLGDPAEVGGVFSGEGLLDSPIAAVSPSASHWWRGG